METKFNKVMIIDDNHIDLYVAAILMKKKLFANEILEFTAATEALDFFKNNLDNLNEIPEIIMVDIYMPEMSGFEFMDAFEKLPDNVKNHCQVFIVSSSMDENDINKANNDVNVVSFQEKPVTADFLNKITNADAQNVTTSF